MTIDNGKISGRQCFRIGILENIAIAIILIPYFTTKLAGQWHFPAMLLGVAFTAIYGFIIYFFSRAFPEGLMEFVKQKLGIGGKLIFVIYLVRYLIRAGFLVTFFGGIVQEYMLKNYNIWWVIIPFVLICGYGGAKDVEKRGRLLELLFLWMIIPLILVAVFSISNLNWQDVGAFVLPENFVGTSMPWSKNILLSSYVVLVVMSTMELMLFTLAKQKKNELENAVRIMLWIVIAIILAQVFIVGILGREWTGSSSWAALSVMEGASFPGGAVKRLDYPVLAFWIIGIFALTSGYMFYCREAVKYIVGEKKQDEKSWNMCIVIILLFISTLLWSVEGVAERLLAYLLWVDVAISIALPLVILWIKLGGKISKKAIGGILIFLICSSLSGCNKEPSVENMDYVFSITVQQASADEKDYNFFFQVADLSDYKGGSESNMKTKDFEIEENSLALAMDNYYKEKERLLDLGHVSYIELSGQLPEEDLDGLMLEISNMPSVSKSIRVKIPDMGVKTTLRDMIKSSYAGENF